MAMKPRPTKEDVKKSIEFAKYMNESIRFHKERFKELDDGKKEGETVSRRVDEEDNRGGTDS